MDHVEALKVLAATTFLHDCDPEIQRQAMDKTARQSLTVLE
jgi:hypothetical protein